MSLLKQSSKIMRRRSFFTAASLSMKTQNIPRWRFYKTAAYFSVLHMITMKICISLTKYFVCVKKSHIKTQKDFAKFRMDKCWVKYLDFFSSSHDYFGKKDTKHICSIIRCVKDTLIKRLCIVLNSLSAYVIPGSLRRLLGYTKGGSIL